LLLLSDSIPFFWDTMVTGVAYSPQDVSATQAGKHYWLFIG
jgi:hypothetical protein